MNRSFLKDIKVYNINGLLGVLGVMCISFSISVAQTLNTIENYKKNYKKAQEWRYKNPDSARFYSTKTLLSAETNDQRAKVYYNILGKMARKQEWHNTAIHYFQKALKMFSNEKDKNKVRAYLVLAYRRQKRYSTALRLANWVKNYREKKKDTLGLAGSYSQLGNIFYNLSQVDTFSIKWSDSSLYYHRKSVNIRKKTKKGLANAYYNFSFAFDEVSPDSAIHYTKLALKSKTIDDYSRVLYNIRIAQINYKRGTYVEGNKYLDEAIKFPISDANLLEMFFFHRGIILFNLQDLDLARKYFNN